MMNELASDIFRSSRLALVGASPEIALAPYNGATTKVLRSSENLAKALEGSPSATLRSLVFRHGACRDSSFVLKAFFSFYTPDSRVFYQVRATTT